MLLTKTQCDGEVMALQVQYPFTIDELTFPSERTKFEGTLFYKKNHDTIIFHLKELIYFWKKLSRFRSGCLVISEANPEVLLSLLLSPLKVYYIIHTISLNRMDRLKRKLLNYSLSKTKQVITVSQSAKRFFLENWTEGKNEEYVRVIYNFYQPKKEHAERGNSVKAVLTVGAMIHYKNPFFWIEVCKEILTDHTEDDIKFIWAGDGVLLDACKDLVKDIPQIQFIGYQEDVEQLYADCTVYFQPSIYESHGIAVLGAMYFKKPCVVADCQGLPESVINNETGYVVSTATTAASVAAILRLLNDAEKEAKLGQAGKERYNATFAKDKWYSSMSELFD